jgi:hypothetical protein
MTPEHSCITWEKAKAKLPKGKENEMGAKCPCEDKCDGDCIFLEEKEDEEVEEDIEGFGEADMKSTYYSSASTKALEEDIEDINNDSYRSLNNGV